MCASHNYIRMLISVMLAQHQYDCPLKPMECRYAAIGCGVKDCKKRIEKHILEDVQKHLDLIISRMMQSEVENVEFRRRTEVEIIELRSQVQEAMDLVQSVLSQRLDGVDHTSQLLVINQTLQEQQRKIAALESRLNIAGPVNTEAVDARRQGQQISVQEIRNVRPTAIDLRCQLLETAINNHDNGVLLWKICDYRRRKQDAVDMKTPSLYSQPFYTGHNGYKMCARVYLNGDGVGKGTHLSLFLVVMRGEYDALLPWPFRQKVTMMLMDQESSRRNLSDSFRSDPTSSSFTQPTSEMNVASGCPLFVQQSVVESPVYCKNDTISIKIVCTGVHEQ